jgi:uncharacterized protein involved in type VI secretion and phage assembly
MIFLDQSNRSFRVDFLGNAALTARFVADRFSGSEYLSRDFHFDVELLSEDRTVELKDVQGQMMIIWLQLPGGGGDPVAMAPSWEASRLGPTTNGRTAVSTTLPTFYEREAKMSLPARVVR